MMTDLSVYQASHARAYARAQAKTVILKFVSRSVIGHGIGGGAKVPNRLGLRNRRPLTRGFFSASAVFLDNQPYVAGLKLMWKR
jgi:hypothetical protein